MTPSRRLAKIIWPLLLLAFFAFAWLHRLDIYDWFRLRGYSPPASIVNLANEDTMTSSAKHIFYINHPQLVSDSSTFRQDCTLTEQTIVLGCYHPDETGIYVYNVQDQRLAGIQQVTAAHEMLHGAYERLNGGDKQKVDAMVNDFYKNSLTDQRIKDTIDAYKKTEPNDLVNEMHSIFGTEVSNLPPALEIYYQRYFNNRAAVVAFSDKYEAEFTSRKSRADQISSQLKTLKAKIDGEQASLESEYSQIQSEQSRLDSLRSSGQSSAYNAGVASYNQLVNSYNAGVSQYKSDVNFYNSLVNEYNAIAGELNQLYGAINANVQTQTTR